MAMAAAGWRPRGVGASFAAGRRIRRIAANGRTRCVVAEAGGKPGATGPAGPGAAGAPAGGAAATSGSEATARPVRLSALRPLLLLTLAIVLLVGGIVTAFLRKPKADASGPLQVAREQVGQSKFKDAIETINGRVLPLAAAKRATPAQESEALRLRAHSIFRAQQLAGEDLAANHESVIDDYTRSEELSGSLTSTEVFELAWSLAATGKLEAAAKRAKAMPDSERPLRHELVRRIVERDLARSGPRSTLAMDLLSEFLAEPALDEADRSWAIARQAELQLADGHPDEAIDRLLRELQRVHGAPRVRRAELHVLLGRAYKQSGQNAVALKQLETAEELLEASDPMRAEVGVLAGQILKDAGGEKRDEAKDRFSAVMADFGKSRAYLSAQFGLAEVLATQERDDEALELFEHVVGDVSRGEVRVDVTPAAVRAALMVHAADREQAGRFSDALRYATLAERIDPPGKAPPEVLRAIAGAKKKEARRVLGANAGAHGEGIEDLNEVDRREVKRLLLSAGRYFRDHSRTVSDPVRYAESLWEAADAFDNGGEHEEAAKAFSDYVETTTDNDPRRPEAKFRLGQVLQAMRQYAAAADRYRDLLAHRSAGGSWAVRSIVPLAQCLLHDLDEANDKEAEDLLLSAVDGTELGPEASEFRLGLIELGRLLYETKRYEEAIRRLTEAIERFPGDREVDTLRYRLADSYRLSAAKLAQEVSGSEGAISETERQEREAAKRERLRRAIDVFAQVRQALDAREADSLSELERVQLRNTMFYLGDCEYDLGEFQAAINDYDAARQRYPNEPASLVAMVQIVNAYVQQGEWGKARTANEAAKRHLAKLPPEVWSSPDMPMERKHWERWLNSSDLLEQRASAAEN